ncbi:O-antigen polymerase [Sporosarcina luteola]|uniref:O-antigen polymerase n=1 Tax=Sporosarcina luteola TaxID=582850 RepID=UPI00203A7188|nr:O-antigen polymerase [Sporosarcina luteola]MCM3709211.1 oligosaccharide repeat unit polymerase [Sporosarcina luteola]
MVIIISSLLSIVIGILPLLEIQQGYELLWLHPFVYLFIYLFILKPMIRFKKYKVTLYFFIALSWLRYVLVPLLSFVSGTYNGVSYSIVTQESIEIAILLVIFELFISSSFLYILIRFLMERDLNKPTINNQLKLFGNRYVYLLFIVLSFIIFLTVGRDLIQFFIISVDSLDRAGDIQGTFLILLRQIIITGIIFSFLMVSSYCSKKYNITKNKLYFYYTIVFTLLSVGIIVGERRSAIVYTALVSIFILVKLFERFKKEVVLYIIGVGVFVLMMMTIYKHFAAFYYGSYTEAISSTDNDIGYYTSMLQAYFFGTQNVAFAVDLGRFNSFNLINLFYDFGRSTFGFNFLLKEKMTMTSEFFNTHIYGYNMESGHVLSAVGYGYIYFGILFSPIIVCINIFISIMLEKWIDRTRSLELKYILSYMLVRFATNIFVASPPLISVATNMFFTVGLVYLIALILRSNKHRNVLTSKVM